MFRKTLTAGIAVILMLFLAVCTTTSSSVSTLEDRSLSSTYESVKGQQVKMAAGDKEVLITLNDSRAAAEFPVRSRWN